MSFKAKSTRFGALILAIIFFATSVGFSIMVVMQSNNDKKAENQLTANNQPVKQEDKLEGTKLKDFTPVDKVDQLQKVDLKEGTGQEVKPGATITAHYTGALANNGTIFQSSHDLGQAATFSLSGVIKGWTDGVPGMKVGGKRRLIIPAALAYGAQSPAVNIPANSDLVFDIELVAIQ